MYKILKILLLACCWTKVTSSQHEKRLYKEMLAKYNPLERPVKNNSHPVVVKLGVILQQIVGVDEKNQIIEINAWLNYEWTDYNLQWKPEEYGGVADIRFPVGKIWKPDVLLYNSADKEFDSTYASNLIVQSTGAVSWIPPGIMKASCKIDITWFPFDDQSCYLKFGSWTYHGFALALQPASNSTDVSEYLENGEWQLLSAPVTAGTKYYDCCPEPYPDLKFYLNIRRRTLYYGFNLIIPSLLISLMTVLGFTLPPDAGEKITLEITILLSVCFFLSLVSDMTPATSEAVPLIGTFFSCCMLVVSASVVFTVVVLNLHYRTPDTHEMSPWVRTVLLNWLPWLLMMERPGHKITKKSLMKKCREGDSEEGDSVIGGNSYVNNNTNNPNRPFQQQQVGIPLSQTESESLMRNIRYVEDNFINGINQQHHAINPMANIDRHRRESVDLESRINNCLKPILASPGTVDQGVHAMILLMQRIHTELNFVTKRMEKDDEDADAENDWKFAAMVVDRVCLFVFSIFIVASTCGIMFSAPHLIALIRHLMTISYSDGTCSLLRRWKGSVYKSVMSQLLLYLLLWYFIRTVYYYVLTQSQQITFVHVANTFAYNMKSSFALTFILGFYVSSIVTRWWSQISLLVFPDDLVSNTNYIFNDNDNDTKLRRHQIARYLVLCCCLVFRSISSRVLKRFPTMEHVCFSGLMTDDELKRLNESNEDCGRWMLPLEWIAQILRLRMEANQVPPPICAAYLAKLDAYRQNLRGLYMYDWINIPLVYTQVAAIAIYSYFALTLIVKQSIAQNKSALEIDMYFPLFTVLEFVFYVGWFQVGQELMKPWGEDDDDAELNFILDRHLKVAFNLSDVAASQACPEACEDKFWKKAHPNLPHTRRSKKVSEHFPKSYAEDPEKLGFMEKMKRTLMTLKHQPYYEDDDYFDLPEMDA